MNFLYYDIIFLVVFAIFVSIFLYKGRQNLRKEGLLLLYRTKWGMKLIDYIGKKYSKTLYFLSYISISIGYLLMIAVLYVFGKIFWIYITRASQVIEVIKVPPIMPLLPYFDKFVPALNFPPFYFIYFIVIIAIIAITHEFAHGIFMKKYGIKIKSTGFGFFPFFLPVFLAAFVEQDEKSMQKSTKFSQMAVLSAGTFVNLLSAILFFIIALILFSTAFSASGVVFDDYAFSAIEISSITMINNISVQNSNLQQISDLLNENNNKIIANNQTYLGIRGIGAQGEILYLYNDYPAIKNNLGNIITKINGKPINSFEQLSNNLDNYSSGEKIKITTRENNQEIIKEVILEENPENSEKAWLGILFAGSPAIIEDHRTIVSFMGKNLIGEENIYYQSSSSFIKFVYDLLEWLILLCLTVALINMLPVGIFDGGRFFYLTILGITKNENKAKKSFAFVTYLFLFTLFLMMAVWAMNLIF